jgi:hypothetical protein
MPGAEGEAHSVQEEDGGAAVVVFTLSGMVKVAGLETEMTG